MKPSFRNNRLGSWAAAVAMATLLAAPPAALAGSGSYLGVEVRDVTKERMAELKLNEERGVEILMVDQESPAGKAGLKEGDVILDFNGTRVESTEQLRRMLRETPGGRTANLGIHRAGQSITVPVQLQDREKAIAYMRPKPGEKIIIPRVEIPEIEIPRMEMPAFDMMVHARSRASGVTVESLNQQLGEYFGVKNGEGVLVRSVEKGSAAEAAGLRAGDVIVQVGEQKIARMSDWRRAMRESRSGSVSISILRDRKPHTLSLDLPERAPRPPRPPRPGDTSALELELPDLEIEMEAVERELDRLGPEFERISQTVVARLSDSWTHNQAEIERVMRIKEKELERVMEELERQLEDLKIEIEIR